MIVRPDFLTHYKTRELACCVGELNAIRGLLHLWAHCQNSKKWQFDLNPIRLKGICFADCDADVFWRAMLDIGFLHQVDGQLYEVTGWLEMNASLVANWENGKKGGRKPSKKTHGLPMGSPRVAHGVTDKIREDKIREEGDQQTESTPVQSSVSRKRDTTELDVSLSPAKAKVMTDSHPLLARLYRMYRPQANHKPLPPKAAKAWKQIQSTITEQQVDWIIDHWNRQKEDKLNQVRNGVTYISQDIETLIGNWDKQLAKVENDRPLVAKSSKPITNPEGIETREIPAVDFETGELLES